MTTLPTIVESHIWVNTHTGAKASIHGAVPYTTETDRVNWVVKPNGFSFKYPDGTIRRSRYIGTRAEAEQILERIRERHAEYERALSGDDCPF